jgi:hypothetical protein
MPVENYRSAEWLFLWVEGAPFYGLGFFFGPGEREASFTDIF